MGRQKFKPIFLITFFFSLLSKFLLPNRYQEEKVFRVNFWIHCGFLPISFTTHIILKIYNMTIQYFNPNITHMELGFIFSLNYFYASVKWSKGRCFCGTYQCAYKWKGISTILQLNGYKNEILFAEKKPSSGWHL